MFARRPVSGDPPRAVEDAGPYEGCWPGGRALRAPTVSRIVRAWKETVTKMLGEAIWQKSFYDHIIRDENDYLRIWTYIHTNPAKWAEDTYYIAQES